VDQCRGLAEGLNTIHRYATFSGTSVLQIHGLSVRQDKCESQEATQTEDLDRTQKIRSLFGRHGDLKPENIVWFPDLRSVGGHGTLKITDFGIARFSTENMWDTWKTGGVPNSPSYRSPECELDGKLTTACDVWALGCVYLQFITWYFGGYKLVKHFGERRLEQDDRYKMPTDTFFVIKKQSGVRWATIKTSVVEVSVHSHRRCCYGSLSSVQILSLDCTTITLSPQKEADADNVQTIEELREHRRCTADFNKLIDMVQRDMLVVRHDSPSTDEGTRNLEFEKPGSGSLNIPNSPRRKSCGDIFRTLGSIKPCYEKE
jgi:serine/threonine protein kinase